MYSGGRSMAAQILSMIKLLEPLNNGRDIVLEGIGYSSMCKRYDCNFNLPSNKTMKADEDALKTVIKWYAKKGNISVEEETAANLGIILE